MNRLYVGKLVFQAAPVLIEGRWIGYGEVASNGPTPDGGVR